jgi:hypothetical protein
VNKVNRTERITLSTPDFGPKSAPAELTIRWFQRSATVQWDLGIASTHSQYFVFSQFLDEEWAVLLIHRLQGEAFL